MTPYWPWLVAIVYLVAYELFAVATHRTTLSELVWRGTRDWSPLPYVVLVFVGVLFSHFWLGLWGPINLVSSSQGVVMETGLSQLAQFTVQLLTPVLSAAATAVAGALVVYLVRLINRTGIQIGDAQQATLRTHARDIILQVEEWAATKAIGTVTSNDKLNRAVTALVAKTGISPQVAADVIHAVISQVGLGATVEKFSDSQVDAVGFHSGESVSADDETEEPSAAPLPTPGL